MYPNRSLKQACRQIANALSVALIAMWMLGGSAAAMPVLRAVPDASPYEARRLTGGISPATAAELAAAMGVPTGDLLAADLMGSNSDAVGVADSRLGLWFPTDGATFAIMATGYAADASLPNSSGNYGNYLSGLNNDAGLDLVRLYLQLDVPNNVNCATIYFAYYSEEFPEYVGLAFNDTFTIQLNDPTLAISGTQVIAPGNFALDTLGNQISVNTVFGVTNPTGTTYDGITPLIRSSTAVTPGTTIDLYFSIQDMGDSVFDSAVFLDRFQWTQEAGPCSGSDEFPAERTFLPSTHK